MTKKDYIAIAGMFAQTLDSINGFNDEHARSAARIALHWMALQFCYHAHSDNSRFDANRFMAACQWETT